MTLIARRSKEFAGTRFLKRGANDEVHLDTIILILIVVRKNKMEPTMNVGLFFLGKGI